MDQTTFDQLKELTKKRELEERAADQIKQMIEWV